MLQLRVVRVVRGWTIWDLTQRARVCGSRLSLVERGLVEATAEERERIAAALGTSPETLFTPAIDPCEIDRTQGRNGAAGR